MRETIAKSSCNKKFASEYLLLNSKKFGLLDVCHILFSKDLEKREFIDGSTKSLEECRKHRWIIFASIVAQQLLLLIAAPMATLGFAIEYFFNLVSANHGLFGLVKNFTRGKVVHLDKESANFVSLTKIIDKRVELDQSIKPGDTRYLAALSMMASKASYENKAYIESTVRDHWKMDFLGAYDFYNNYQGKPTTQAFICRDQNADHDLIVVAFRGTETFDADAWSTDVDLSWYQLHPEMGRVHGGFMKALGLQPNLGWPNDIHMSDKKPVAYYYIRNMLRQILQANENAKFIVTGHSLGGALAILFPAILAYHEDDLLLERLQGVYTFGQPRVGNEKFGEYMQGQLSKYNIPYVRSVYCNDIVPRLPYDDESFMFKHFGMCLYFNSFYEGKIVAEEPNKNYFSVIYAIPKIVNAIWELIRGFILPYSKGPDYKEGVVLRFLRVVGLVIPGVPAHMPKDYVNATRSISSAICMQIRSNQLNSQFSKED